MYVKINISFIYGDYMKRLLNILLKIIKGIIFIIIGIIYIVRSNQMVGITVRIVGYLSLGIFVIQVLNLFLKKKELIKKLPEMVITLTISILFLALPTLFINIFAKIFGLYAFLQALSSIINAYIYKQDRIKGIFFNIFSGVTSLIFAYLLLFSSIKNAKYLCIISGIYIILYGVFSLINIIKDKSLAIPMPIIFTMFLPKLLIRRIKKDYSKSDNENNLKKEKVDMEILFHLANSGSASMGHVEISFGNKIYSYACYNYMKRRLFGGVGDGILGEFDRDHYIEYCVFEKNRFILSYGIKLNDEQKKKIKAKINELKITNTVRWYPEAAYDDTKEYKEMANQIYQRCDGKFYKFIKGKYKTFFVFRTNCVEIANEILSSLGTKLIILEGLISPGTYYSYLEKLYNEKNNLIVSKTIYTKEMLKNDKKNSL